MKKLLSASSVALCLLVGSAPLQGWFDGGHMVVACIAYQNLAPHTRARVDALLKLNKMYPTWTKGIPAARKGLTAFVQAATWADCIKRPACAPGFTSDGGDVPPGHPSDTQNIGYRDVLMHRYWHFIDLPLSAGAPGRPPAFPNAQTEIALFAKAIAGTESDNVKSYDVVWLEHLVGDIHQPLHATSRFTKDHPAGDNGGNALHFCAKPCTDELHAFWDGLMGDGLTVAMATKAGKSLMAAGKPAGADNLDPASWASDSFGLAKADVYVAPISDDNNPSVTISPPPDAPYQARATAVARTQVALAGYRLAGLLNKNLK
jgi:hypothetical protein